MTASKLKTLQICDWKARTNTMPNLWRI